MDTVDRKHGEVLRQLQEMLKTKRFGAFSHLLNQALGRQGHSTELCRMAVEYYRAMNNGQGVVQWLTRWSAVAPTDPQPLLQLAGVFQQNGATDNAIEGLTLAQQAGADPGQIAIYKAKILLAAGQYARAAVAASCPGPVEAARAKLLQALAVLAGNLAAASKREDLRELVTSVSRRSAWLQADGGGLVFIEGATGKRLGCPKKELGLVGQMSNQIKTQSCGCVIGSADLLDLAGPAARVHDGSFWGSRSRVYVLESDEDLLTLGLATFDVRDVLMDEAVTWVWGPTALEQLERFLTERDEESPMNVTVSSNQEVPAVVDRVGRVFHDKVDALFKESSAYYAGLPKEHWSDILGDSPPRPPRILLITTQFSSYMKFATRDLAATFERMGWEVQAPKESQPTQRLTGITIPRIVATFRPDLVWQINYTRSSWGGGIPDKVPFVCWNQDNMPHLLSRQQAAKMGQFDFLACLGSGVGYAHSYGYAPDRLVPLSTCVDRSIFRPGSPREPTVDVSYVSHQGWPVQERIEKILVDLPEEQRRWLRPVLNDYAARLSRLFLEGGDPLTKESCGRILLEALRRHGIEMPKGSLEGFQDRNHHFVANAIWRHQAVQWVADCGASLTLYGLGWDQNPDFRPFARGIVEHGEELATAFRSSRIALQAVLAGNEHQRLWEAAACGVPVLMRYHPQDEGFAVVRRWLDSLDKGVGRPLEEVIHLPGDASIAERFSWRAIKVLTAEDGLVTSQVLQYAQRMADTLCVRDKLGKIYDEMSFRTPEQLRCQMEKLLHDEVARGHICEKMLQAVEYHDYRIQVPRVIREIRQRLLA